MLTRASLTEQICDRLDSLQTRIRIMNGQGLYDANIYAQDIICRLFNAAYDLHLTNLNKEKVTVEGIDLCDKDNRVSVQVTSENSSTKIKKTITNFIDYNYYNTYDRLVFAFLKDKKKYTTKFDTKGCFSFNPDKDIIDLSDFAKYVKVCPLDKQKEILDILTEELEGGDKKDTNISKETILSMEKRVMATCLSKLIAVGVDRNLAQEIINYDIKNDHYIYILEAVKQGKLYLQGEFGSGKSHALCILYLKMLHEYRSDKRKPLPLFVSANEVVKTGGIQKWFEKQETGEYNIVFIDGCDEISTIEAQKVLEEAQYLRVYWDNTLFLLGGRPLHFIVYSNIIYTIHGLSNEEAIELISFVSGKSKTDVSRILFSVEQWIGESLKRPFYSLIYALILKQKDMYFRMSYSDMVRHFVELTLNKCNLNNESIGMTLEKVAMMSIDRNLGRVHISEANEKDIYVILQETGLLILNQDNTICFPLPIIAQWFAAEGVLHRHISINEILNDKARSSRWRYAFSIMFSKMTFDDSLDLFGMIVKKDIGSVAEIINNGTADKYMKELPTPLDCGKMIRKCVELWADALGDLKIVLTPFSNNTIMKLAIDTDGGRITTTWSDEFGADDICILSARQQTLWHSVTVSRGVPLQATWPWVYTFEAIQQRLKEVIRNRSILCDNDDIIKEYVYRTTLELLNKGNLCQELISLDAIEKYREYRDKNLIIRKKIYHLDTYFSYVDQLYSKGIRYISQTVPLGDINGITTGFVWSFYSEQRLYERVAAIYEKAINAYTDYIKDWFSSFSRRMSTAVLMPMIFHADLSYKECKKNISDGPILSWHMEALPMTAENAIDITLNASEEWLNNSNLVHSILEKDRINRTGEHDWLFPSLHSEMLRCFESTPITDVVFQWIENDLKGIGWI